MGFPLAPIFQGALPSSLGDVGRWLSSPFAQLPVAGASIAEQNRLQTDYEADIDRQMADMMQIAGQIGPATLGAHDEAAGSQLDYLNRILGAGQTMGQDRYNWSRRNLEGYGTQQYADIDRAFDESLASTLADMNRRGLASTTAVGSQRHLNQELRGAERRRLGEDLTRMRQDILGGIQSENQYNTMGGLANIANFYGQEGVLRPNMIGQGYTIPLNTLGSFNFMPPGANQIPGQVGGNLVDPVDATKAVSTEAPWIRFGGETLGKLFAGVGAVSDKNAKVIGPEMNGMDVLDKLNDLAVYEYEYKPEYGQQAGKHVGPMAQDFKEAFGLGDSDRTINLLDAIGLLFVAVKELAKRNAH